MPNNPSEYKVVADKIVSDKETIVLHTTGGVYLDSVSDANRIATMADVGNTSSPLPGFLTYTQSRDALPTLNTNFGWDSDGLWFGPTAVDNESDASYPVFTDFTIPTNTPVSVSFDFVVPENGFCSDIGVAIYVDGETPYWTWGTDLSRIAAQFNCPNLQLLGRTTEGISDEEDLSIPEPGTYRFFFNYNPNAEGGNVTAGYGVVGFLAASVSIDEVLPAGNYRIGFASDNDGPDEEDPSASSRSYIKNLTIIVNPETEGEILYSDSLMTANSEGTTASLGDIKTRDWGYPTEGAIAIMPTVDNEGISLKSSDSAAIRWHVRNNGSSVVSEGQLHPTSATVTQGDGVYVVTFTFPEENSVPTTAQHNYQVFAPNSTDFEGVFLPVSATTTTITFHYDVDPGVFDAEGSYINQPSVYAQFEVDEDGAHIKLADWSAGQGTQYSQTWDFTKEGAIHFPNGPSNNRTGYGDVLRFASSIDQAIITGPVATESAPNANRLVVAGQDGSTTGQYDGEGGDIYLWAGKGGGTNGDGGDIKVDGGDGLGAGSGGYVKIRGGNSNTGNGGFVEITSGYSNTANHGGDISINAVEGGTVTITGNGNIDLYSTSGVYINESLVATQSYVTSAMGTSPVIYASSGSPLTGALDHVGKLLYANLTETAAEFTIPTNATVAFPVGSEIKFATSGESPWHIFVADVETTTVWGESYNYTYAGTQFIVPINSTATLLKVETDRWILSGLRLTD